MKTISFIFILLLSLTANEWSHAQSIAMRVPDTTVVSGSSFDLPIYVDSSFTGKNVMSYMLQLSFNQSYLQPVSVIYSGTKCAPFGSPSVNTTIAGKITIAAAGTSPLIGKGIFIISFLLKAVKIVPVLGHARKPENYTFTRYKRAPAEVSAAQIYDKTRYLL